MDEDTLNKLHIGAGVLTVKGVVKDMSVTLLNMEKHLRAGGLVRLEFNQDGTHFTVEQI